MRGLNDLKSFARAAAAALAHDRELAQFEVYCSSSEQIVARLNYTADIPCRGVEEIKSLAADGLALRIVSRRDRRESGIAFEAGDLSLAALRQALERARRAAFVDPHFPGLPAVPAAMAAGPPAQVSDLMRAPDRALVAAAWEVIRGALGSYAHRAGADRPRGFVVGGDLTITRDRIALAGSGFSDVRTDQSARFSSSVTVLIESLEAKGTASALGDSVAAMRRAAARLGREAATRAFSLKQGERPPSGLYRVLLGPQPIAEILNYMVVPSLTTGAFYAASSAYQGRFGTSVMDRRLSLTDDPTARRGAVRRRITCEGLPVRRTELIREGRLVGLLSNFYDSHRLATDEHLVEKLGATPGASFAPANGFRLSEGGERRFDAHPASAASNVLMRSRGGRNAAELIGAVGEGIYMGRVWYTYPINGQRAGDFTCTISGDSYLTRNGRIAAPLVPNSLRLNAKVDQVFNDLVALGARAEPALVWGSPEAYYVPALVVDGVALASIGIGQ